MRRVGIAALVVGVFVFLAGGYFYFHGRAELRTERIENLDRAASFTLWPTGRQRGAAEYLHVHVIGKLNGTARIARRDIDGEVDLCFSERHKKGSSSNIMYIPVTATAGTLEFTYWYDNTPGQ